MMNSFRLTLFLQNFLLQCAEQIIPLLYHPMYCKMLGICESALLKKKNVWKIFVERNYAQPLHCTSRLLISTPYVLYDLVRTRTDYRYKYSTSCDLQVPVLVLVRVFCSTV